METPLDRNGYNTKKEEKTKTKMGMRMAEEREREREGEKEREDGRRRRRRNRDVSQANNTMDAPFVIHSLGKREEECVRKKEL